MLELHIRDAIWAIKYEALKELTDFASSGSYQNAIGEHIRRQARLPRVNGTVAVLPLSGMITQRGSLLNDYFGGTSTEAFAAGFSRAMNADRVKAVVIDTDSPGGTTAGVESLAEMIHSARGYKPIVSIANSQASSAAYWIASSADKVAAAPGADVGSIGVFRMHQDVSEAMKQDGIATTFIAEPQYKVEGNPFEPLSADAIEHQRAQVHETYERFEADVARNRGITAKEVGSQFGQGRSFNARQAAKLGLVDKVASLPQVLSEMGVNARTSGQAAQTDLERELTEDLCHAWIEAAVEPIQRISGDARRRRLRLAAQYLS